MNLTAFEAVAGVLVGAVIGSYLTCVSWRIPRRMPITGRSICPACKREIPARWNIPVLGWLLLRGRARCCGVRIPVRYPLIEIAAALAGAAIAVGGGIVALAGVVVAVIVVTVVVSLATVNR